MAWRCETFREIAPTHTTGRESTPGPQYRSQHPNQAHHPGPPHHPPPLTASSPPPGKSAPPTAPQAPRASLESPGARRFTLYRPPLEQGKVRPVTGSAGHWSWSGPLVRASTAAPEFLRTHLLSGIQAGPQGATPPVSKICQIYLLVLLAFQLLAHYSLIISNSVESWVSLSLLWQEVTKLPIRETI